MKNRDSLIFPRLIYLSVGKWESAAIRSSSYECIDLLEAAKVQLSWQKLSHYSLITACFFLIWLFWSLICTHCLWFWKYRWRRLMFVIAAWFLFHSVCSELIRGISYCSRSGRKVNQKSSIYSIPEHHILTKEKPWVKHDTFKVWNTQEWRTGTGNRGETNRK